jgi:hypothetical protein
MVRMVLGMADTGRNHEPVHKKGADQEGPNQSRWFHDAHHLDAPLNRMEKDRGKTR